MNDELNGAVKTCQEQWEAFKNRYPLMTAENRFMRVIAAIFIEQTPFELAWQNGFYQGFNRGWDRSTQLSQSVDDTKRMRFWYEKMLGHENPDKLIQDWRNKVDEAMRLSQSVPQAPISGQPESPESHSSFHNQGGDFPDEDLSK